MFALRRLALPLLALLLTSPTLAADNTPVDTSKFTSKIKLACVGDSITAGAGAGKGNAYPTQLQKMLGDKWDVKNFGVSGSTLMNAADKPYQKTPAFKNALEFKPDVAVIMLGTNDSKPHNWPKKENFSVDYKDLASQFQKLGTRVFVVLPCPVPGKGAFGINEAGVTEQLPVITTLADDLKLGLIDVHAAMSGQDALFPDRVHPNAAGAELLAKTVYKSLTGKPYTGLTTIVVPPPSTASKPAK